MYGLVHEAVHHFVMSLDGGEETFATIVEKSGQRDLLRSHFMYPDEVTLAFIGAACEVLGVDLHTALTVAGQHFVELTIEKGYKGLMMGTGQTFLNFVENLDNLHQNLSAFYPGMTSPSFRCERYEDDEYSILLHYHSSRDGLWPLTISILQNAAKLVYECECTVEHLAKRGDVGQFHDQFKISVTPNMDKSQTRRQRGQLKQKYLTSWRKGGLSKENTDYLFPWHIEFDKDFIITSVGHSVERFVVVTPGETHLKDIIRIVRPAVQGEFTFDQIIRQRHNAFLVAVVDGGSKQGPLKKEGWRAQTVRSRGRKGSRGNPSEGKPTRRPSRQNSRNSIDLAARASAVSVGSGKRRNSLAEDWLGEQEEAPEVKPYDGDHYHAGKCPHIDSHGIVPIKAHDEAFLVLKGEMVHLEQEERIMFCGLPHIRTLAEMHDAEVYLDDIPLHTGGRDVILASEHQGATLNLAAQLEQLTSQLDSALTELHVAKKRADDMIYSILPKEVAGKLLVGDRNVSAKHPNVTILFSDIVGFTAISGGVKPGQVMMMLDELYEGFDKAAEKCGVYKVETIGDAYMVVSGAPVARKEHARAVLMFALAMVEAAAKVKSALDGKPLRIRVGVHSGPCMSGVVGHARPRWCLFGDTVNVASRMESTGLPGEVQVSPDTYQALREDSPGVFRFDVRGETFVKGKGVISTYFLRGLVGEPEAIPPQPQPGSNADATAPKTASAIPSALVAKQTAEEAVVAPRNIHTSLV